MSENKKVNLFLVIMLLGAAAFLGWKYNKNGIRIDPVSQVKTMYAGRIVLSGEEKKDDQKQLIAAVQSERSEETETESEKNVEQKRKIYRVINISSHLTVRSGPSKDTEKVGSLNNGTVCRMEELSEDGKWMKITAKSGVKGWVSTEYLAEMS